MKVRVLIGTVVSGEGRHGPGDIIDIVKDEAEALIAAGLVETAKAGDPEAAQPERNVGRRSSGS